MNEITTTQAQIVRTELSVDEISARVNKIVDVMRRVMTRDVHYGTIPGTGDKPTLLKPGAELLMVTFRLAPKFDHVREKDGNHLTVYSTCTLYAVDGTLVATGSGSCSTKESKYAWRKGGRKCPTCGAETIIKGKQEYGGGWLCFAKKGGCGAKFKNDDKAITDQETGRIENPDIADVYNTVLKMADKRALVAATLIGTGASSMFTQDHEDFEDDRRDDYGGDVPESSRPEATNPRPVSDSVALKVDDIIARMKEATKIESLEKIASEVKPLNVDPDTRAKILKVYTEAKAKIGAAQ